MPLRRESNRRAASISPIDDVAEASRQQVGFTRRPRSVFAKCDQETAAAFDIPLQGATGQTEGLGRIRGLRRDMARMRTILREKEIENVHGR